MQCHGCGLSYSGEVNRCPQCGTAPALGLPPPEFLPLRGLANLLTILLAVVVAVIAARLGSRLPGLESIRWPAGYVIQQIDKAADVTIFGLGILFVVWLRRARINAEQCGWPQRRARGWAFWGWIVPVVSLWIPFQIVGDIWRAGQPPARRRATAWLPALWWTSWLLSGLTVGARARPAGIMPHLAADTWTGSLCCLAISGVTLIAIIRAVSDGPVGSPPGGAPVATPAVLPG